APYIQNQLGRPASPVRFAWFKTFAHCSLFLSFEDTFNSVHVTDLQQPGTLIQVTKGLHASSSSSSSMDMQGMGWASRLRSTRVVVVQKTKKNQVKLPFIGLYPRLGWCLSLATLGIAPPVWAPRMGSATTVSPIKSNRRGTAFHVCE
uniref:Uncharacterized protein n=1 Tax=Seriola lalandi dorsalis TaxID=1841481 RepID=A0A3B4W8U4_SERLL